MFKTVCGLALGAFVLKRTAPKTYNQLVQAADDLCSTASNVTTALRGQAEAYCAEAAKDASERLSKVDPDAVQKLRAMLDGSQPSQQAQQSAPHRAVRRRP